MLIELEEYQRRQLPAAVLTEEEGTALWADHGDKVAVEFPTPITGRPWQLTSQGWVGYIPLGERVALSLAPRVPLSNVFRMLEYAYRLEFVMLEGLMESSSLRELYERLANVLAKRVLDRMRIGLYRAYIPEADTIQQIRGRLDLSRRLRRPWAVDLPCEYHEHTPDVDENQILAWTLLRVARSGACSDRVLPTIRHAYRSLQGSVSVLPFKPAACVDRLYNRLNEDYRPLHALCRFFLEHSGPTHELGDREMIPFLVSMPKLFESFVAAWSRQHLPLPLRMEVQETVRLDDDSGLRFQIDLVLYDIERDRPLAVLDTKYKSALQPSEADVQQVVAYAASKGCKRAFLVYPVEVPFDTFVGDIRVSSLCFGLGGDLEVSGSKFADRLLAGVGSDTGGLRAEPHSGWDSAPPGVSTAEQT